MRTYEFGKYSGEFASIIGWEIFGRSIIVDGCTTNTTFSQGTPGTDVVFAATDASGWRKLLLKIVLDTPRAIIGHTPIILFGQFRVAVDDVNQGTFIIDAYKFRLSPDFTDATYRYRDVTGSVTWYGDAYSPVPGQDIGSTPFDTQSLTAPATEPTTWTHAFEITSPLIDCLRRGTDLEFMLWPRLNAISMYMKWSDTSNKFRPYMRLYYLFPVEFFQATGAGTISLGSMVNNATEEHLFYLGALERGETGTPVKGFIRNFSARALPLVEVLDDHPEWSDPVQTTGSGTGQLDYVSLALTADSQKYTVKFSSSTEYEVLAEAYRDNTTSDHPSYDSNPSWEGATGSNWTSPTGDITIPSAAWQPGTLVNDEFEIYVRGNSSDATWPSDSAEQIQITRDSGGSPDAANWRPINGRRTRTTASVTVDATTKSFPCRAIDSALWTVGVRAFIGDGTNLHEGTVASADEAALGSTVFTGSGLNDCAISGNFNGAFEDSVRVEIDATGTPDTYKISYDGGGSWAATGQSCSTGGTLHDYGLIVTFGATTGHTLADRWDATLTPFQVELSGLTNDSTVYGVGSKLGTSLPIENLAVSEWGTTTAAAGASESPANRIYLQGPPPDYVDPASAGFSTSDVIYIVDVTDPDIGEYGTISAVGSTYIDVDANLANDYPAGSLVMIRGVGEAAFWLRAIADSSTTEELKQARLNVRA